MKTFPANLGVLIGFYAGFSTVAHSAITARGHILNPDTIQSHGTEKGESAVLFHFERNEENVGSTRTVQATYHNPQGEEAVRQKVQYTHNELVEFEVDDFQTHQKSLVQTRDQELFFSQFQEGRSEPIKTSHEKYSPNTLVTDQLSPYFRTHWQSLLQGETLPIRLIVPQRLETVGFDLYKENETTEEGTPAIVIKMKPSSFVISLLVKPLYFTVEKNEPHRTLKIVGRMPPKVKKHGNWKDLDASLIFQY